MQRTLYECKIVMGLRRRRRGKKVVRVPCNNFLQNSLLKLKKNRPGNSKDRDNSERASKARQLYLFSHKANVFPPFFPPEPLARSGRGEVRRHPGGRLLQDGLALNTR